MPSKTTWRESKNAGLAGRGSELWEQTDHALLSFGGAEHAESPILTRPGILRLERSALDVETTAGGEGLKIQS